MSDMIDFKKLRANANTVLQGDYPVVADKVTYKKTQTDKHMWTVNLKVTAGPYAGRVITHNMVLSPELDFAVKRFFREMEALGADEKFFDSNPSVDAISAQITGRHALATFKESEKEFRGEKREEVVQMMRLLSANLENPIEQEGDKARMPYGERFEVKFVREDGVWKVADTN